MNYFSCLRLWAAHGSWSDSKLENLKHKYNIPWDQPFPSSLDDIEINSLFGTQNIFPFWLYLLLFSRLCRPHSTKWYVMENCLYIIWVYIFLWFIDIAVFKGYKTMYVSHVQQTYFLHYKKVYNIVNKIIVSNLS